MWFGFMLSPFKQSQEKARHSVLDASQVLDQSHLATPGAGWCARAIREAYLFVISSRHT